MRTGNLSTYIDFVKPYYAQKDIAHDFTHIERILRNIDRFSVGIDADMQDDILHFLACFHGLSSRMATDEKFKHETTNLLTKIGLSDDAINDRLNRLSRHDKAPVTFEEKVIHDANYVEGIAKLFTVGGVKGDYYEDSIAFMEKVPESHFYTPVGQRLQKEGVAFVQAFLERLKLEL